MTGTLEPLHGGSPFVLHLGIVREPAEAGVSRLAMDLRPELLNRHGGGHGGVVMTLLDCAMAHAARARVNNTKLVITVDMHVAFMRATTGRLVAVGRATGGGRSVCFCEAHIVSDSGEILAQAMGTFRYIDPPSETKTETTADAQKGTS